MIYKNKDVYVGDWNEDKMDGEGELKYSDGTKYKGHFKDKKRNGYGEFYAEKGIIYRGEWKDDKKEGRFRVSYMGICRCRIIFYENDIYKDEEYNLY